MLSSEAAEKLRGRGLRDMGASLEIGEGKKTCSCLPKLVGTPSLRRGMVHLSKDLSISYPPFTHHPPWQTARSGSTPPSLSLAA